MGGMHVYYDRRAPEFDDWWFGTGLFAERPRSGWNEEVEALLACVAGLPPAPTLDLGCGTGFLTRHLRAPVLVGFDWSLAMLRRARTRLPRAALVRGDALALPFKSGALARVFTSHLYGHLLERERQTFLSEARAVGHELVVVDAGTRGGDPRGEWQERSLGDGSRHRVYKRFFTAEGLAAELGGGRVLHEGHWFVVVATLGPGPDPRIRPHQDGAGD